MIQLETISAQCLAGIALLCIACLLIGALLIIMDGRDTVVRVPSRGSGLRDLAHECARRVRLRIQIKIGEYRLRYYSARLRRKQLKQFRLQEAMRRKLSTLNPPLERVFPVEQPHSPFTTHHSL